MRRPASAAGCLGVAMLVASGAARAAPPPAAALLTQLRAAPDPAAATALESRVIAAWHAAQSPAIQLLSERAARTIAAGHPADALPDLDAALDLAPDQAELWRLRAEAHGLAGDDQAAAADLAQALARDPTDFPALRDLSQLAEARADWTRALAAWRQFMALDPRSDGAPERLHRLERKAQGDRA